MKFVNIRLGLSYIWQELHHANQDSELTRSLGLAETDLFQRSQGWNRAWKQIQEFEMSRSRVAGPES